jgi:hypothetical protein
MDMKRKTCDIRTWGKKRHLFLDISSTNIETLVPLLRNPQNRSLLTVFSATSTPPFQPLRHQRNISHPVVNCFKRQTLLTLNRKHFFMNVICIESFYAHKKGTAERCSSVIHSLSMVAIFTTETSLRTCACASPIWTVLKLDCAAT